MQNNLYRIIKNPSNFRGVFCLTLFFISFVSFAQPQLKLKELKKNFGFVKKGEVIKMEFDFTNSGDLPLIISKTEVECSCTTVTFPQEPILPKETAKIVVSFDTKSVYDRQDRVVEIISNAKNSNQKIRFKGVVLK